MVVRTLKQKRILLARAPTSIRMFETLYTSLVNFYPFAARVKVMKTWAVGNYFVTFVCEKTNS